MKAYDNIHEVQIHLACNPDLVAVASNDYDKDRIRNIPDDRTGVLLCLPLGKIYCMKRKDYTRLKAKEEHELNRIQKHKSKILAEQIHVRKT